MKHFRPKVVLKLFSEGQKSMVFHPEIASSNISKLTLQFLKKMNVHFMDKWIPKTPAAAPMDYMGRAL
ncbi:hypothetical protein DPMN_065529 [Dreissena polymorpha]|uniref:Uncharacterized protein n=1 Tax=Dreissena polymorpha TaxID=45954 RepID=A0A9D3YUS7_DREPO|nr:hypothetical protein DPMN_065529 [Dreissena polymorpha]